MVDKIRIWEPTDPAIKLFGKPIQLPEASLGPSTTADAAAGGDDDVAEHCSCGMDSGLVDESTDEKANGEDATSGTEDNLGKPIQQSETTAFLSEGEKSDAGVPQEKILKKPDKIIPCPRCASMDTKFCYFNNYNVNQPRYFCRKCQRYWTSGGTLRKLPVGAGRRKSKSAAVDYPQIAVNGDFPSAAAPHSNGVVHHPVALKGSILSFVPDQHTHQISSTKVADKARQTSTANCSSNFLTGAGVVVDDNISGSAGSVSNIENEDECKAKAHTAQSYQVFQPHMMCFPAPLWPPYPWNPAQYNCPLPTPINFQPGFPMPFYPAPMYMAWNMPWSVHPSSPNLQPDPKPPTLGKHSRSDNVANVSNVDENEQTKEESPKPSIWIPKTLRIDDLEEAAKSSMRATLGIKNDNTGTAGSKGHSKPFSSQTDATSHGVITLSALLANPAALSRSMNFHEST